MKKVKIPKNGSTQNRTGVLRTRISYAAPTPWNLSNHNLIEDFNKCRTIVIVMKKKDPTGIEPVTQGTAVPCSTAELRILIH